MAKTEIEPNDVERLAKFLDLKLKQGNSHTIASMLTDIRANVYRKASALEQEAPLAVFFEART
jgi:hypothetical protein